MVVFKHGSVVFFNVNEKEQTEYLRAVTRHCGESRVRARSRRSDEGLRGASARAVWLAGEVVAQTHRFRETLECRLRPGQEKYHEMGQVRGLALCSTSRW
jgi:hypothetical protein